MNFLKLETTSHTELQSRIQNALATIFEIGGFDGGHHKQYCIDQVVRILTGCGKETVHVKTEHGSPYSYEKLVPNKSYKDWVKFYETGEDGHSTYSWDEGIAP